jgi:hypothetical protein
MTKADEFRKEAEVCERMARTLSRHQGRTEYRRMASQWRQLADRVAHLEERPETAGSRLSSRDRQ